MDKTGVLPQCLCFSLAALAAFYRSDRRGDGCLIGKRGNNTYEIRDDDYILDFFAEHANKPSAVLVRALLENKLFWDEDLNAIAGLTAAVAKHLENIETKGVRAAIGEII
jgi:tagaturonate reductase